MSTTKNFKEKKKRNCAVIRQQRDDEHFSSKTKVASRSPPVFQPPLFSTGGIQTDMLWLLFWLIFLFVFFVPVSLSLCQIPEPSPELVEKYKTLKATFYKRIENAKFMEKINALIEQSETALAAKAYIEAMEPSPRLEAAGKFTK